MPYDIVTARFMQSLALAVLTESGSGREGTGAARWRIPCLAGPVQRNCTVSLVEEISHRQVQVQMAFSSVQ